MALILPALIRPNLVLDILAMVYDWWFLRFFHRNPIANTIRAQHCKPTEPGKSSCFVAEMNDVDKNQVTDDAPAPVPDIVAKRLPRFDDYGVSNCHDHHHSADDIKQMASRGAALLYKADENARNHNERSARKVEIIGEDVCWPLAACRDCHRLGLVVGLHRLECGHALCHQCLTNAARCFYRSMDETETREEIKELLEAGGHWAREAEFADDPRQKKECNELARSYIDGAYFEAQATCCNMRIEFPNFIQCLDTKEACAVWLAWEEMRTAPKYRAVLRCGWPDCRKYLPPQFMWQCPDRHFGHCISCGGNSKQQDDGKVMCPAR